MRPVSMARPNLGQRERALVNEVLDSDVLALGPMAVRFEQGIAELAGRRFGVSCSSGTAGLHMVVRSLGLGAGDEVITTPFSFVASSNCLLYEGVRPRFVDIEPDGLGLDPDAVAAAAGPQVVGVLPVHVFGRPCRIDELALLAGERGWHLIEDACEALGSTLDDRPMGSYGAASVFAFYPNKQVTTGEGGVVVTDDEAIAEDLRSLRNQGRDADGTWLNHVQLGYNYRLDELSAAVGVGQLERFDELRAGRARAAEAYERVLGDVEGIELPAAGAGEQVDWFVYVIRLDPALDRERLMASLAERGVASRPYFSPLHLQPFYRQLLGHAEGDFPVTERVARSTLAIPWSSLLTDEDVEAVAEAVIAGVREQAGG